MADLSSIKFREGKTNGKTLQLFGKTPEELVEALEDHIEGLRSLIQQIPDQNSPDHDQLGQQVRHFQAMIKWVEEMRLSGPLEYFG